MSQATMNVTIDADVKELAIQLLGRMGIDQTTAIDMFFRQIIAERRLPFQPVVDPTFDERIVEAAFRSNPTEVTLTVDADGNAFVDKELYPEIYDWVVNG
ncbi:MAG: type II toxin-antitoxin system RelB/DinJ family antitoxin [Oscillospiraceae bacterium]|nr:type II toxin-antitoxin system RelB/DinJ family antitoxin [Oscillospiraceae bacterium]